MVDRLTFGVGTAGSWGGAWVHTLTVDALLRGWTVVVGTAAQETQSFLADMVARTEGIAGTDKATSFFNASFVIKALVVTAAGDTADRRFATATKTTFIVGTAVHARSDTLDFSFTSQTGGT